MEEIESQDVETEAEEEAEETVPESESEAETEEDTTEDPPKTERPKETPQQKKARLERELERLNKKLGVEKPSEPQSGGLDETQLDYLDLKGITEAEDIEVVEKIVAKTGMTLRQALKDDYVIAKLDANRAQRAVKDATPSSTKRHGGQGDNVARAVAKFKASGDLPEDFALRSQVINAMEAESNPNKPSWH